MLAVLKGLTVEKKALIVTADANESVELSARNIPGVTVITADGVNVLDVLHHDKLIMTKAEWKSRGGACIMRDPRDIIKRPVITERSMEMMAEKIHVRCGR